MPYFVATEVRDSDSKVTHYQAKDIIDVYRHIIGKYEIELYLDICFRDKCASPLKFHATKDMKESEAWHDYEGTESQVEEMINVMDDYPGIGYLNPCVYDCQRVHQEYSSLRSKGLDYSKTISNFKSQLDNQSIMNIYYFFYTPGQGKQLNAGYRERVTYTIEEYKNNIHFIVLS